MTVICYYCRADRKEITAAACPNNAFGAGKHYYVKKSDPKTDRTQRVIPRLETRRTRFDGKKAVSPTPDAPAASTGNSVSTQ